MCRRAGGYDLHGEPYHARTVDGRIITVAPDDIAIRERWDCPEDAPLAVLEYARYIMPSLDRDCTASGL